MIIKHDFVSESNQERLINWTPLEKGDRNTLTTCISYYHHLLLAKAQIIELNLNSAICWMAWNKTFKKMPQDKINYIGWHSEGVQIILQYYNNFNTL